MIARYDCRFFLGHRPCIYKRPCEGCRHFAPFGRRILIIKLAAMGDVLRTTPLLRGLRRLDPDCHITWLTEPESVPMLQGILEIDRLLPYSLDHALQLSNESFDRLFCFDKEPKATGLAMKIRAAQKAGFGISEFGNVMPLSRESEYTFELGINDDLKFRQNKKTYPELIYECAGLPYPEPQEYLVTDLSYEISQADELLMRQGVLPGDLRVGLNTGAGDVFATKKWTEEGYARLTDRLVEDLGARVLLLGGPAERERNQRIAAAARHRPVDTGTDNPIRRFAGIVGCCDLVVTGDTLAMHIAVALRVPVLVILGSTCHQEIELYGAAPRSSRTSTAAPVT
ncbi:MAG: glycosyltransferase family 9 protein [Acidobacteria bacterium]|nr:glycosyltransferase family 9 protein [Acidobacteriota bacterium]